MANQNSMKTLSFHVSVCRPSLPSHVWNTLKCFNLLAPRRGQHAWDHDRLKETFTSHKSSFKVVPIEYSRFFAKTWKNTLVCPFLKKPGLDHEILKNFCPISNLQFVSKLTEKAVAKQIEHTSINGLFPSLQSAYCKYHSTETALLKEKNDLLLNMNNGLVTILVLLDLSTAFDTVDHNLLLQKLQLVIGIQGTALSWF